MFLLDLAIHQSVMPQDSVKHLFWSILGSWVLWEKEIGWSEAVTYLETRINTDLLSHL